MPLTDSSLGETAHLLDEVARLERVNSQEVRRRPRAASPAGMLQRPGIARAPSLVARAFAQRAATPTGASTSASSSSNRLPSPVHALPCMQASVRGRVAASFSSSGRVLGAWAK
jgi:hypothetical protein